MNNTELTDGLLRLEYEFAGVTTKTLMFGICYLPPSAQRRCARNGLTQMASVQSQSTQSFCKHTELYPQREEAQALCDARNAAKFKGEKYFHVIERWAVPVVEHAPFIPLCYDDLSSKERDCYNVAVNEAERDFEGEELQAELDSINREFFGK